MSVSPTRLNDLTKVTKYKGLRLEYSQSNSKICGDVLEWRGRRGSADVTSFPDLSFSFLICKIKNRGQIISKQFYKSKKNSSCGV